MSTVIYVSRYSNKKLLDPSLVKIPISRGLPRFKLSYELVKTAYLLCPSYEMLSMYDRDKYEAAYRDQLERMGVEKIKGVLRSLGYGSAKAIVLLCFEDVTKPGQWCHRTMFARWWQEKTGMEIKELPDPTCYEATLPEKDQTRLF